MLFIGNILLGNLDGVDMNLRTICGVVAPVLFFMGVSADADTIQHIGNYDGWGSVSWTALNSLNDGDDSITQNPQLDFVGDSADPAAYWGIDDNYVYFRMRLNIAAATADDFSDAHLILIDTAGDGVPNYGFGWDSKSNDSSKHGLEMLVLDTAGSTWDTTNMDDIDGSAGQKLENDINGGGRTTDGYVQTTDGISTDNFGDTTYLDYAVSLSYLAAYVPDLATNTQWRIQLGSIANATDHNVISADVAGGVNPEDSLSSGWSETIAIPEPAAAGLIILFGGGMLISKRIFSR